MSSIGDYLRTVRRDRGWSAREASKRLGVSYNRLLEIEAGHSRTTGRPTTPSVELLLRISQGYEIPLPLLLELAGLAGKSPDDQLEAELIQIWRTLSPKTRNMAIAVVRAMKAQDDAANR